MGLGGNTLPRRRRRQMDASRSISGASGWAGDPGAVDRADAGADHEVGTHARPQQACSMPTWMAPRLAPPDSTNAALMVASLAVRPRQNPRPERGIDDGFQDPGAPGNTERRRPPSSPAAKETAPPALHEPVTGSDERGPGHELARPTARPAAGGSCRLWPRAAMRQRRPERGRRPSGSPRRPVRVPAVRKLVPDIPEQASDPRRFLRGICPRRASSRINGTGAATEMAATRSMSRAAAASSA